MIGEWHISGSIRFYPIYRSPDGLWFWAILIEKDSHLERVRECTQKFLDWPPGARTANGTVLYTSCSYIPILWVILVSFAAINLCVASQRVFIVDVVVYFVIDSVQKLLDTPSYFTFTLILYYYLRIILPSGFFASEFPTKILNAFLIPAFVLHSYNIIFRDFIMIIIFVEGYKLWSSSLCHSLHDFLDLNILLTTFILCM
jgi:hypothetical protein